MGVMKPFFKYLLMSFVILAVTACDCGAFMGSFNNHMKDNMDDALEDIVNQLLKNDVLNGKELLFKPYNFYDQDKLWTLGLSTDICNKLEKKMVDRKICCIFKRNESSATPYVVGTWKETNGNGGKNIQLTVKVRADMRDIAMAVTEFPNDAVTEADVTPRLQSYLHQLVRDLENHVVTKFPEVSMFHPLEVNLEKFNIGLTLLSLDEMTQFLEREFKSAVSDCNYIRVKPTDHNFGRDESKTSGVYLEQRTRMIKTDLADTELIVPDKEGFANTLYGRICPSNEYVWLQLEIMAKNTEGKIIDVATSSDAHPESKIPVDVFPETHKAALLNIQKKHITVKKIQETHKWGGFSKNNLMLDITTPNGDLLPEFSKSRGDIITFVLTPSKPSYVYLFCLNEETKTSALLYPGKKFGKSFLHTDLESCGYGFHNIYIKGSLIIPDNTNNCSRRLIVYDTGEDTIFAVASEKRLTGLPKSFEEGEWANSDYLKENIRRLGLATGKGYAEAQLKVISKE